MTHSGELPPDEFSEPGDNGDQAGAGFDTADETSYQGDAVTAEETDAVDIDDAPPISERYDAADDYDENTHNQQAKEFLDSLHPIDGTQPEIPIDEQNQAWQVLAEAAMIYLDQGPTYPDRALGGDARMDVIEGEDGTGHEFEVVETPPHMMETLASAFKIKVQAQGDEQNTGRGADYRVESDGVVRRKDIDPMPRDLHDADAEAGVAEIRDARMTGTLAETLGHIIGQGVANAMQENRMGIGRQPIGLDEARRLARLLLGRDLNPSGYRGPNS